jgi:GAF domain-containing protein
MKNHRDDSEDSGRPVQLDELKAYATLSRISFADQPLTTTLGQVADLAKQVLREGPAVSVTLLQDDEPRTAAFTDDLASQLDERQYDRGFGPCLDAAVSGQTVRVTMSDPDAPYPDFRSIARGRAVTHSLSVGLPVATGTVGALNLYTTGPDFSDDSVRVAGRFAGFTAVVLSHVGLHQDAVDLTTHLQAALRSRAIIEQARGIIMAQNSCSSGDAFAHLTRLAELRNTKLRIVAEQIVGDTRIR